MNTGIFSTEWEATVPPFKIHKAGNFPKQLKAGSKCQMVKKNNKFPHRYRETFQSPHIGSAASLIGVRTKNWKADGWSLHLSAPVSVSVSLSFSLSCIFQLHLLKVRPTSVLTVRS